MIPVEITEVLAQAAAETGALQAPIAGCFDVAMEMGNPGSVPPNMSFVIIFTDGTMAYLEFSEPVGKVAAEAAKAIDAAKGR